MAEQAKRKPTKPNAKKKKRKIGRTMFYGIFFTVVIGIVCGIIGYLLIILNGERLLEEHGGKLEFGEASIIYDAGGNEISRLYDILDHREMVEYSEIPEDLLNAIVATEDQRFREHSGLDFWAIGRAVVKDIIARSAVEGGSTITQQLAKNVFLSADKTFFRKATEASIAVALEQQMTKDEILTMYLNRIYFGRGIHGVKAAASYYFGKELSELELWESATLAAMPKGPNRYNPISGPEQSMNRRAVVLRLMYEQQYITQAQMEEARAVVYEAPPNQEAMKQGSYHAFVDFVIEEAIEVTKLSEEELRVGGFRIYTTLDVQAQEAMDKEFADSANFEESKDEQLAQSAMIIIDHRSGEIKALAGGRDYAVRGWNRVVQPRQPGSAFKPIVAYGPALESGNYFPWTVLKNDQKCFSNYCPTDRWGAAEVTMEQAMKDSRNLAAVWTLNEIGVKQGAEFAEKLGITLDKDDMNLAMALGGLTRGASPLQMAKAYSVMANGGKSVDPHTITRIEGRGGNKYTYKAPESKQLMKPETAAYLTDMMQAVIQQGGTGTRAAIDRPVAGKTGTTQHGIPGYTGAGIKDAWFVGYTPEWTAAVWMGYDKTDVDHILQKGSAQSAALFAKVMQPAMRGVEKGSFKRPQRTEEVKPDPPAKVTNVSAVYLQEEEKVVLSWDALSIEGITYEVFRRESGRDQFIRFLDMWEAASVDDMSVFPGVTYEYYVVAHDGNNELQSERSETVKVEIPDTSQETPEIPIDPVPTDPETEQPGDGEENGGEEEQPGDIETPVETEQPEGGGDSGSEPLPTLPAGVIGGGEAAGAIFDGR